MLLQARSCCASRKLSQSADRAALTIGGLSLRSSCPRAVISSVQEIQSELDMHTLIFTARRSHLPADRILHRCICGCCVGQLVRRSASETATFFHGPRGCMQDESACPDLSVVMMKRGRIISKRAEWVKCVTSPGRDDHDSQLCWRLLHGCSLTHCVTAVEHAAKHTSQIDNMPRQQDYASVSKMRSENRNVCLQHAAQKLRPGPSQASQ
jgi:hypothetical protein